MPNYVTHIHGPPNTTLDSQYCLSYSRKSRRQAPPFLWSKEIFYCWKFSVPYGSWNSRHCITAYVQLLISQIPHQKTDMTNDTVKHIGTPYGRTPGFAQTGAQPHMLTSLYMYCRVRADFPTPPLPTIMTLCKASSLFTCAIYDERCPIERTDWYNNFLLKFWLKIYICIITPLLPTAVSAM